MSKKYSDCIKHVEQILELENDAPFLKLKPETNSMDHWKLTEVIPAQVFKDYIIAEQYFLVCLCRLLKTTLNTLNQSVALLFPDVISTSVGNQVYL